MDGLTDLHGDRIVGKEKAKEPKSDFVVAGIYIYPADVFEVVKTLKPTASSELKITGPSLNYLLVRESPPEY
jgi:glucose-1-phosphate thymidylyltransferase